ncbi:hypothetical protein GOQ29_01150 [Clostridium sp. D2Q-14]|uniref:capping complex subunit for YIEGIA n=1 Tax=Anaeromonas gelatinilytica TaxID=2683194 RepID=UPI00193B29C0|nr:hypothetical protein [Anaeromonas gelatinilytica]MBS4534218.1 hypothetical protein [Anaeromonas gelatinilytica]
MDIGIKDAILAIVTTNKDAVEGGSVPVFYVNNREEMEHTALMIAKVTLAMIHDLDNDCFIIVKH